MGEIRGYIHTFTGKKFYPLSPKVEDLDILDIAQGLSHVCRYNGQVKKFYTVAEHSVVASYLVPSTLRLTMLLHDAPEAYICDLPKPVKILPEFAFYNVVEDKLMTRIADKWGLRYPFPKVVNDVDRNMVPTELPYVYAYKWDDLPASYSAAGFGVKIRCHSPKVVRAMFLLRFSELSGIPVKVSFFYKLIAKYYLNKLRRFVRCPSCGDNCPVPYLER